MDEAPDMLEFLVTTELHGLDEIEPAELKRLFVLERQRGFELIAEGSIKKIWRIPGSPYRTISIRHAPDLAKLQADLESLPMFNWLKIEVIPVTPHPVMLGTPVPD
jgi:muconolactone D-isomerase